MFLQMAPRAAFLSMLGHDPKALALRDVVVGADREWARDVAGVDASEYFRFKEEYMEAQAEAEYQSGEWDYFFRSSMP